MGEAANTAVQGAIDGNPLMIVLVMIAAVVGITFVADKVWFHRRRRRVPTDFEPASKEDAHALRTTNHDIKNTLQAMAVVQTSEASVSEEHSTKLDNIGEALHDIRIQSQLTAARLDDLIRAQ